MSSPLTNFLGIRKLGVFSIGDSTGEICKTSQVLRISGRCTSGAMDFDDNALSWMACIEVHGRS